MFPCYGGRYILNAGEIHQAVLGAVSYRDREGRMCSGRRMYSGALRQCHAHLSADCARLLESTVCLNDLGGVTGDRGGFSRRFCSRVKYKALVGERWGFYDGVSYGRESAPCFT